MFTLSEKKMDYTIFIIIIGVIPGRVQRYQKPQEGRQKSAVPYMITYLPIEY